MLRKRKEPMKRLLEIPYDKRAIFVKRPNRFLGICSDTQSGQELKAHVRDPGRLRELLYPGNQVLLSKANKEGRKTDWDLIAARSDSGHWVLVNSGFHSTIASKILSDSEISPLGQIKSIKPEVKVGKSRLDFLVTLRKDKKVYVEVKGCTLEKDGRALFPDAPTERGRRHLMELGELVDKGYMAMVVFLVLCPHVECFDANKETDPYFFNTFHRILRQGVRVYPVCLEYKDGFIWYKREIGICNSQYSI